MKEAYCSFEVAKLLKEKGFLQNVNLKMIQNLSYYDNIGLCHNLSKYYDSLIQDKIDFVIAPTHQMACAWLREVHSIFIEISVSIDLNGNYHYSYFILNEECEYVRKGYTDFDWSYKDAVEAAIKYCLENLINYES